MAEMTQRKPRKMGGSSFWTTVIFGLLILIPCFVAFSNKLREFIMLYRGQVDGVFAISPIVNYLLASLGFFFLFWCHQCDSLNCSRNALLVRANNSESRS